MDGLRFLEEERLVVQVQRLHVAVGERAEFEFELSK